jgi:hypothetical protein
MNYKYFIYPKLLSYLLYKSFTLILVNLISNILLKYNNYFFSYKYVVLKKDEV